MTAGRRAFLLAAALAATLSGAAAAQINSPAPAIDGEARAAMERLAREEAAKLRPGIVGDDDRRILDESDPALRAVGRLNLGGRGFCTATLVAPDRVATAAHCLFFARTGAQIPADRLHFLAGYRKGEFVAHRVASSVEIHPAFTPPRPENARAVAADIALVTLERPIPPETVAPIPLAERLVDGARLSLVSYARDRPELPSIEADCSAIAVREAVVWATCDVISGASGGPLMVRDRDAAAAGAWRVGAVVSGYAQLSGRTVALGAVPDVDVATGVR